MDNNTPAVVREVVEQAIADSTQIKAVAIMSDGSEEILATFYPDERFISAAALIGLTAHEASHVVGKQFGDWLSQG